MLAPPRPGEYVHVAAAHPGGTPGVLHLHLSSEAAARQVSTLLHGQVLTVGSDRVSVEVTTDAIIAQMVPGSAGRRRA